MKISPKRGAIAGTETLEPAVEAADPNGGRKNGQIRRTGRRKVRTPKPIGRRSRPETPLLRWKFDDKEKEEVKEDDKEKEEEEEVAAVESEKKCGRRALKKDAVMVSARKLAAGLWKLQPDVAAGTGRENRRVSGAVTGQLGFQPGNGLGVLTDFHHGSGQNFKSPEVRQVRQSPQYGSRPKNGYMCKIKPSVQISNSEMEGATKWDPICSKTLEDASQFYGYMKPCELQVSAVAVVSALELKLEQARARIQVLEHEHKSSKKKLESFLRKVSEEKAAWRSREHVKIRAIIYDVKSDLNMERKYRQRVEMVNSKLANELAEAKLLAKRYMQDYEKERKARELIEEVCEELAKEIGDDKEDAEALKKECMKIREDVEDERKMLQMAEVWREERVQMKLVDVKVAVEAKYSQMNRLVADLENFLKSRSATLDSKENKEAEMLQQAAASMNIQDVKDFSYEPSKAEDIFAVLEDVNMAQMNEKDIEACAYSPASNVSKVHGRSPQTGSHRRNNIQRRGNGCGNDGDLEGEESGWETVSQLEDPGSSDSPDCSVRSVNKGRRNSTASGSVTEWEDKMGQVPKITEITEVSPLRQPKKGSTVSRLWKHPNSGDNFKIVSVEGVNDRLSDGRQSNGSIHSLDKGSVKGVHSPSYLMSWSSPDSRNPNYHKGMKGCIEWPRGAMKSSLKAKLMAARIESQKVQLRQVLKQKD
uniref:Uncharacterized protein n=1 Tax=Kalanchoe fedtschenkoi TaxID=63787 RepID=A0A7N0TY40_KALFE